MKTSISSEVWEKKKALIAKLYMEEEWPLKQVIKQIRSDDFNPSETQLRSRLKKWRVTKPSRQTRKKPQGSTSGDEPEWEKDVKGSSASSPRNHKSSPAAKDTLTTRPDWSAHPGYPPPDVQSHTVDSQPSNKWNAPLAQPLTPGPLGKHVPVSDRPHPVHSFSDPSPTTASFEQPAQTSPVGEGLVLNTTSAVTPTYAGYPLSPESCLPSPRSAATPALAPWPSRSLSVDLGLNPSLQPGHWYPMPFEPITPPSGVSHSAPSYRYHMPMVVPSATAVFSPEFHHYGGESPEFHGYDPKSWKRAMSFPYDFHGRPSQAERKPLPYHSLPPADMVPLPSTQPAGPHAVMCAPIVPYMGQDPMAQMPPGLGY